MTRSTIHCISLGVLLLLCDLTNIQNVYASKDPLYMGVFPRRNASLTHKLFRPLTKYLSQQLNREIKLVTAKNFKTFWKGVTEQKYDIVHYNQYHYVVSHKQFGYSVILKNEEFGKSTIAGSIIVRKDSGIEKATDLKNKTIVFGGGPKAMQSYIIARYLLEKNGLPHGDYKEKFSTNPPNAIFAAYRHQSPAAGSGDAVINLDMVKNSIDINQMKFLLLGPSLPHLPWAVKENMNPEIKQNIQRLMSNLSNSKEGRKLLKSMKLTGVIGATDKEYDQHRSIIKAVYDEEY